jgi:hypothetical protein
MTNLNEMTGDERANVAAAVEALRPVRMVQPGSGRIVTVGPDRVAERLTAGYMPAEE